MTSAEALARARALGVASLDAQLLLARVLVTTRTGLIANDERVLSENEVARWSGWLARRAAGEPVAYLLGEKEFCGLMFEVRPGVLVPRPETELLVDWAAERLGECAAGATVLDLGTGSGAIALAIKHRFPQVQVTAVDMSLVALDVAGANAARLGLDVELVASSWFGALGRRRFDLIVANPPYIGVDRRLGERPPRRRRLAPARAWVRAGRSGQDPPCPGRPRRGDDATRPRGA